MMPVAANTKAEGSGKGREGGEVKGKEHSSTPLSMRMDLDKNFKLGYVIRDPKIVDVKYIPFDRK